MKNVITKPNIKPKKKQTIFVWELEKREDGIALNATRLDGRKNTVLVIKDSGEMITCYLTEEFKLLRGEDACIKQVSGGDIFDINPREEEVDQYLDAVNEFLSKYFKE